MATEATNNSAAAMASASSPVKVETISLPGFANPATSGDFDPKKYKVKYLKLDMDDPVMVATLEMLETQGLTGVETVILNKTGWTFLDKYLMLVTYLEKA
jgi:hypothetical protein